MKRSRSSKPKQIAVLVLGAAAFLTEVQFASGADFQGRGNEPGWTVTIGDSAIELRTMDGKETIISPKPASKSSGDTETFEAQVDGQAFSFVIIDQLCVDTMSGMPHPKSVTVSLGDWKQAGCGGDPVDLLKGKWAIKSVNGAPGSPEATPILEIDAAGKLAGGGICNRFFGSYSLTGEGLSIGALGASMMACEQALMDQERTLLDALGKVSRFEADSGDALRLIGSESTIDLRRL